MDEVAENPRQTLEQQEQHLNKLLRRSGEFIAYFELADSKMIEWQKALEQRQQSHQATMDAQLEEIKASTQMMREVMTEAGVARWRIAAEETLAQGQEHITALEEQAKRQLVQGQALQREWQAMVQQQLDQISKTAELSSKKIAQASDAIDINAFRNTCDHFICTVNEVASSAISRCQIMLKWFNWKVAALAMTVTLISTLATGFYLSDEMPWETHKTVMAERHAGKTLLAAWSGLSSEERQRILVLGSNAAKPD